MTIADFFGISVDYLLTGRQPWEPKEPVKPPRGILIEGQKVSETSPKAEVIRMISKADDDTVKRVRAILEIDQDAREKRKNWVKSPKDNDGEKAG